MDLSSVLLTGAVTAVFGFIGAWIALKINGNNLDRMIEEKARILPDIIIAEVGSHPEKYAPIMDQVRASIQKEVVGYITGFLKSLHEHPDKYAPIIQGLIGDLSKSFPQMKGELMQNVAGGGLEAALPFIPKQYRVLVTLAQMFMGGRNSKDESSAKSGPFG